MTFIPNGIPFCFIFRCCLMYDFRYNIIELLIEKKKEIMKDTCTDGSRFYFEFSFNNEFPMGLCYDYGWSYDDITFEICFYNFKEGIQQIRTYI